ncbi:hypothetical protein GQ457_12G022690 [Hibiscus cannabinus]
MDWIQFGDMNTRYFHSKAISRRRRSNIIILKIGSSNWCDDNAQLRVATTTFFSSLFAVTDSPPEPFPISGYFPMIDSSVYSSLCAIPLDMEIKEALFSMAPLKAPGIDGLHAHFYQLHWDIVGDSLCKMVKEGFANGCFDTNLNRTAIVLIPKIIHPKSFADFRPISLCSFLYKLITKTIVRRLQHILPSLIGPHQTSFIKGRSISENFITNQEIIHSMNMKNDKNGWMTIKVDLTKAFDRLRWDFNEDTLVDARFPAALITLIMHCVTSSTLQVQWNGEYCNEFQPSRGIHQGDPLSPYLFNLTMERLSHLISLAVSQGSWAPFRLVRNGTPVSHLFFADDLILYAKATPASAVCINSILDLFGSCSGHELGLTTVLQAELWRVLEGLKLAWSNGHERLLVQIDSSDVHHLLSLPSPESALPLVRSIVELLNRAWFVDFSLIPREANAAADRMAKNSSA